MKGAIKPDHIPVNKYQLIVLGLPPLTPTEVSGVEDELQTVDLPDRTVASGGNRASTEFTMKIPAHHSVEVAACEIWYREGQEPVVPSYKKAVTLIIRSLSGAVSRTKAYVGCFISKRVEPDLEMENEGEMAVYEYTVKVDDVLPL
jgi:hypothetical protein